MIESKPALLVLDDGTCFEGTACGACAEATGEAVFVTGMTGYQETLTDPSYHGQIVVFTAAHVGNYGVSPLDDEASIFGASGVVFHSLFTGADAMPFPHWWASGSLNAKLAEAGVSGICGVDTRALTLHLRQHGARNAIISATDMDKDSLLRRVRDLPSMQGQNLVQHVTTGQRYSFGSTFSASHLQLLPSASEKKPLKIAVLDYGVKRSILQHLVRCNMQPEVWPATADAKDILATSPDGVMLSNGPGDPEPCTLAIATVRNLVGRVPLFGICLGHQLLGLALGGKTYKLPFGHHGLNHPVKDLQTGRVVITSQNHGFCVDPDSLPATALPTHWNLNDDTLEGLTCTDVPVFSVQFHPEAAPGTWDACDLFERFRGMIESGESEGTAPLSAKGNK